MNYIQQLGYKVKIYKLLILKHKYYNILLKINYKFN